MGAKSFFSPPGRPSACVHFPHFAKRRQWWWSPELLARRPAARGDAQKLWALGATPRRPRRRAETETHRNQRAPRHIAQLEKGAAGSSGRKRRLWASHIKRRLCPFCPTSPRGPFYFVSSARLRKTCPRKGRGHAFRSSACTWRFRSGPFAGKGVSPCGLNMVPMGFKICPQVGLQIVPRLVPDLFPDWSQIVPRLLPDCFKIAPRFSPESP